MKRSNVTWFEINLMMSLCHISVKCVTSYWRTDQMSSDMTKCCDLSLFMKAASCRSVTLKLLMYMHGSHASLLHRLSGLLAHIVCIHIELQLYINIVILIVYKNLKVIAGTPMLKWVWRKKWNRNGLESWFILNGHWLLITFLQDTVS